MDYAYMSYGDRKAIRDIDGTQPFQYDFASISASSSFVLDIAEDKPLWKKYLPFNHILIINNSGVDVKVYVNQDGNNFFIVPNGVLFPKDLGAIWSIKVENLSATTSTTANKLNAIFTRTGMDSDKFSKEFSKTFIGKLLFGVW